MPGAVSQATISWPKNSFHRDRVPYLGLMHLPKHKHNIKKKHIGGSQYVSSMDIDRIKTDGIIITVFSKEHNDL